MPRSVAPSRSTPVPVMRASLDPSPDGASFAAYQANSAPVAAVGLREGQTADTFWFRTTLFQTPSAMAFRAASSGHTARRGPDEIARGTDVVAMFVASKGGYETTTGGETRRIEPGDIVVRDFAKPFSSVHPPYELMALMVVRERAPAALVLPGLSGAHIPAADGAARLLAGMLAALLDAAEGLSVAAFDAGVEGICATLVGVLAERGAAASPDVLRAHALAFIDQHLGEPDLGPARLAAALGLSRSGLYRLFEPLGGVNALLLRRRLDRCAKTILAEPGAAPGDIARIAAKAGFGSEAQLARAFRRRFALTPRAFQAMAARTDPAGLVTQAESAGFTGLAIWLRHTADV